MFPGEPGTPIAGELMAQRSQVVLTILRRKSVEARTGLSRSTIYTRVREGTFPRPIALGDDARAVGWIEAEINTWIAEQIAKSRAAG